MSMMIVEEYCKLIYKRTFAHAISNAFYAAHVNVRIRKNPFDSGILEEAFRKYVWDTPLSNLDLAITEDPSIEDGVLILDTIEPFGDGESVPEKIVCRETHPINF